MARQKSVFVCQNCSYESPQWVGQCPSCDTWNSFEETVVVQKASLGRLSARGSSSAAHFINFSEISSKPTQKTSSGIQEFDRVLGGGFVPGQVILLAGEPGIGKSTLITQIAQSMRDKRIFYVCGEENVEQVKLRAHRLGVDTNNLYLLAETNIDVITASLDQNSRADLIIVDSVQTLYSSELTGVAGSVSQVKYSAQVLTNLAKSLNVPLILVGHVTKEGTVAGPKVLEHIVDTVLYLEGDTQHLFRMLKTAKNRFGPVSEVGVFEMKDTGVMEVSNPSQFFLEQRKGSASGSCVTVVMEGFRPILFEIQALATKSFFGYPKRTASGFSANRLAVLIAILEKRCGLNLSDHDVYLSVAGGFKVSEYACDLAVCLAIASSLRDRPIGKGVAAFGECGLSGEVREVAHQEKRIKEAKRMGFDLVLSSSSVSSVQKALEKVL